MKNHAKLFAVILIAPFVLIALGPAMAIAQDDALTVPEITVLGDLEKTSLDFAAPATELSGARLKRQQKSTLGETLARETGVNSSQFGPNSSRPVLRGLDGERVRVLQNGTGVLDASGASPDHAVATDPLVVERIEVVRGPSALIYGTGAIGGVVNVVTKRIPESQIESLQGTVETRYGTNDNGRAFGFNLEGSANESNSWAYHFDGGVRAADDYKVPNQTITNSFNRTWNGAVGTSYVKDDRFAGVSYGSYDSRYGTVAEKAVNIALEQRRFDFSGGLRDIGWFDSIRVKSTLSTYNHREIENGSTGTTFKNNGGETRVDLKHKKLGRLEGLFGLQTNTFTFEALGDEAFLPVTRNVSLTGFAFEEIKIGRLTPSAGVRFERATVASDVASDKVAKFGASETKSFTGTSASLGFTYNFTDRYSAVLTTSYSERAPNYQELFANGKHVATHAYEVGDKNLSHEISRAVELALRTKSETAKGSLGIFVQDFPNFIALSPRGAVDDDSGLSIYDFRAVEARLTGLEAEYRHTIGLFEIEFKLDAVRGYNRQSGASLPRMPPLRETVSVIYKADRYLCELELQRNERQTAVASGESETPAYTFLNLGAEVPFSFDQNVLKVSLRATNLFDAEARNHVSLLKDSAPLPGRGLNLAVQALF